MGLTGSGIGVAFASLLAASLRADFGDYAWALGYRIEGAVGVLLAVLWLARHAQAPPAGGGLGSFGALRRMPGWRPLRVAYFTCGFACLLALGFLTTRLANRGMDPRSIATPCRSRECRQRGTTRQS